MKFQKTLLAATLAFAAFTSTNAALNNLPDPVKADAWVYQNAEGDVVLKLANGNEGYEYWNLEFNEDTNKYEFGSVVANGQLPAGYELALGGQVDSQTDSDAGGVVDHGITPNNNDEGVLHVWSQSQNQTGTAAYEEKFVEGTFISADGNVVIEVEAYNAEGGNQVNTGTVNTLVAGALPNELTGKSNTQLETHGVLAYNLDFAANGKVTGTGAALTHNGLGLASVSDFDGQAYDNIEIDATKGTVTASITKPNADVEKFETRSYRDDKDNTYFELVGKGLYQVNQDGTVSASNAKISTLTQYATGVADVATGTTESTTVTKSVNSNAVVYGESKSTQASATNVLISSAVAGGIFEEGDRFGLGDVGTTTEVSSQSVTTGIVKSEDGKNTYGVVVSQKETGKADKFTEVNADGINTTGVINAADFQIGGVSIVQNIQTSVGEATQEVVAQVETQLAANQTFVTEAVAAVDAGLTAAATDRQAIRAAAVEGDAATLASANAYTDNAVAGFNSRVGQLNSRIDDVEKTSYRGIAIALATQQQIPNIGAGQYAVFGGVGHYEGESAAALGVASVLADGRTSLSAALGFGGSEVGGRVGVSYVFGGK
ncbi:MULTISPECIES: YadA-like family protein [Acinetobacter]|uniref:YadA-like family protein n=1 Tax=Acinetobacter pecorum TaxID=2762215 RepID=A0ABR8VUB8_9GAMM|nr:MULTISPECIES: YadA-like family protein [Acinetobacter]MBD8008111.1 YadA-like family protein [Acinetobacter pecorum]OAL84981.1 hypothetical protein AY605_04905 [Acinetobacter sp. SFD]